MYCNLDVVAAAGLELGSCELLLDKSFMSQRPGEPGVIVDACQSVAAVGTVRRRVGTGAMMEWQSPQSRHRAGNFRYLLCLW